MDIVSLKRELIAQGKLFHDPKFKPDNNSLYLDGSPSSKTYGQGPIQWKRPQEIVRHESPHFVVGGMSRLDLDQGSLGNCWFVAAAATLAASSAKLFMRVVLPGQSFQNDYAGIFRFRFWWYGQWVDIDIDDYLPCDQYGLLFCRNTEQPNEFWPCLMEKAYAKLNGSYESLEGGKFHHALIDMTGGITEVISLETKSRIPRDFYTTLVNTASMNSMMGASIFKPYGVSASEVLRPDGLYMGHAYSITGLTSIQSGHAVIRLLRLRNPWGHGEWNGAWSDRSEQMKKLSTEQKQSLNLVVRDDGEFWIQYEDFIQCFDEIQVCHLVPDAITDEIAMDMVKDQWSMVSYPGSWLHEDTTCGCCSSLCGGGMQWDNEQYYVRLTDQDSSGKSTLIVSLMEKEVRTSSRDRDINVLIGYNIFRLFSEGFSPLDRKYKNRAELVHRTGDYEFYRELCRRFTLEPGLYVIIPQTYKSDDHADYLLRLFTKTKANSERMSPNWGADVV